MDFTRSQNLNESRQAADIAGFTPSPASGNLLLQQPVTEARAIGGRRAELFLRLGVKTNEDLLNLLPRDYVQFQGHVDVSRLAAGQKATVEGCIIQTRMIRRKRSRFEALLEEATGRCILVWFNRWDLPDKITPGCRLRATGTVSFFNGRPQMMQPQFECLPDTPGPRAVAAIEPVYPATANLPSGTIRQIVLANLPDLLADVSEWFGADALASKRLLSRRAAYEAAHRPQSLAEAQLARHTLAYHEFFIYQLAVALRRAAQRNKAGACPLRADDLVDRRIRALLDFSLTDAQNRVVKSLRSDLAAAVPMNRLIQGDVGCGKTVVALYAMLLAVASGRQAALLAPTELLAEQHFLTLKRYLAASRVGVGLLTAGVSAADRKRTLSDAADGSMGILVGTHALLREELHLKHLALLVVDEQHKFGVQQRAVIRDRYVSVHMLIMTATPIPRTLAMTLFGDLDVSTIDQSPPGRGKIVTRTVPTVNRDDVYTFARKMIAQGRQVYVVAPAIDDNVGGMQNAVELAAELSAGPLKDCRIALLHGRIDRDERMKTMEDFRGGRIDALVSTTVIEVGVDVPNACLMVVEHADHFGLAQLHQLRGRIGRGGNQSYCILVSDQQTEEAARRMAAMVRHSSGFKIAEEDLKLRGMGELIGTQQSGHGDIAFTDLLFDPYLLPAARAHAMELAGRDPHLIQPAHMHIRRELLNRFARTLSLADVG